MVIVALRPARCRSAAAPPAPPARPPAPRRRQRHRHLHVLELRNVARHRIVEVQLALLDEHHDGDADDRLGHRGDAEHRGRQPSAASIRRSITPCAAMMDHLALARHDRDGAGDVAGGDAPFDHLVDALASRSDDSPTSSGLAVGEAVNAGKRQDSQ